MGGTIVFSRPFRCKIQWNKSNGCNLLSRNCPIYCWRECQSKRGMWRHGIHLDERWLRFTTLIWGSGCLFYTLLPLKPQNRNWLEKSTNYIDRHHLLCHFIHLSEWSDDMDGICAASSRDELKETLVHVCTTGNKTQCNQVDGMLLSQTANTPLWPWLRLDHRVEN